MNTYADLSTPEGLNLLEIHLTTKLRELEEEEARKIIDLERDLAELNIESNERSFCAAKTTEKNIGLDLEQVLADLKLSEKNRGDAKTEVKDFGLLDLKNGNVLVIFYDFNTKIEGVHLSVKLEGHIIFNEAKTVTYPL
jgi:hypothetical protein